MSMKENLIYRPVSGASSAELAAQLRDLRARTLHLSESLSAEQLMGPMLPVVNPVLWEIGHVGWFHEYWTLRHVHGEAAGLDRADALWNSSSVAHDTRWGLPLPDRDGVYRYMADVLERQAGRLAAGVSRPAKYFYELAIRHEDMHVEALAYMRQTLGYERPAPLGRTAIHGAGLS
jgi:iron(II)-dependent oxidoreductase